jgi:O-antigen/teichoic acid export membrane protein
MKVIITRDLSVEEVGMLYGVISFITFLSMYSDLGCTEALSYFLPKHIVKKEFGKAKYLVHFVIGLQITTSLIIYVLLFLLAPWLSDYYFKSPVIELLQIA